MAKCKNARRGNPMILPPQSALCCGHAIQPDAPAGTDYTGLARRWKPCPEPAGDGGWLPAPDPSAYMAASVIAIDDGNLLSAPPSSAHDRNTQTRPSGD